MVSAKTVFQITSLLKAMTSSARRVLQQSKAEFYGQLKISLKDL